MMDFRLRLKQQETVKALKDHGKRTSAPPAVKEAMEEMQPYKNISFEDVIEQIVNGDFEDHDAAFGLLKFAVKEQKALDAP